MTNIATINRIRLEGFIRSLKGQFFTVEFTKKNGDTRVMNARTGVKIGVTGKGSPNGLFTSAIKVFDVKANGFRQINLDTVRFIKTGGVKFLVTG